MRNTLFLLAVLGFALPAFGADPALSGGATPSTGAHVEGAPVAASPTTKPAKAKKVKKAKSEAKSAVATTATIVMENGGKITFKFFPGEAPNTVDNFAKLADKGFYNGLTFHRVEPGFVVQGGDPAGNGSGDPGYTIKAEFNGHLHLRGTVAMARAQDLDSAGSQFYICLQPAHFLDHKYTVFGQVTEGMEVVDGIKIGDKMKSVTISR